MGWTQVLIPNPRDTDHICAEMEKYKPTNMANVPSLYQMLLENPKFKAMDHSTLGTVISAAAPFPQESQVVLENIIGEGKLLVCMSQLKQILTEPEANQFYQSIVNYMDSEHFKPQYNVKSEWLLDNF